MLDEYCARYGVRGCYRHLCYLADLLERAEKNYMIDPTLIHYSFAFCASHVHGNRPDGVGSITHEEKERFQDIKIRLRVLLEQQITNFRLVHSTYIQPTYIPIYVYVNRRTTTATKIAVTTQIAFYPPTDTASLLVDQREL